MDYKPHLGYIYVGADHTSGSDPVPSVVKIVGFTPKRVKAETIGLERVHAGQEGYCIYWDYSLEIKDGKIVRGTLYPGATLLRSEQNSLGEEVLQAPNTRKSIYGGVRYRPFLDASGKLVGSDSNCKIEMTPSGSTVYTWRYTSTP